MDVWWTYPHVSFETARKQTSGYAYLSWQSTQPAPISKDPLCFSTWLSRLHFRCPWTLPGKPSKHLLQQIRKQHQLWTSTGSIPVTSLGSLIVTLWFGWYCPHQQNSIECDKLQSKHVQLPYPLQHILLIVLSFANFSNHLRSIPHCHVSW